jgi:diguanylate cyclase (GGDEF)-like protein/PAS domain S-box-containing protein
MEWSLEVRKWLRPDSLRLAFASDRRLRTQGLLTISTVLLLVIFTLRFAVSSPDELVLLLCVVPIALVAIALGVLGGLAAATLSYGVFVVWALVSHADVTLVDHLARALSFFFVGGLVGYFSEEGRRLEDQASRWFELSLDMAATAGFDGFFKRINPTFGKTLGYTQEELLETPFMNFVHPDDVEATEQAAAGLGVGNNIVGFENRYRAKDGTYRWLEWASTSVLAEQLIYASVKDITDRKKSGEALLEAEERFRTAFESAPIGIALVDMDGHWLQANSALCRLTGYSLHEILNTGFGDITHPDDRAVDQEQIRKLREGLIDAYSLEKRFVHSEGYPVWVSFNCSLVRLPGGPPLYLITQVEDISTRKELEEQLRHLAQHDPLTELFNRRRFDEELARQLSHVQRYGTTGALLILDLDSFKEINDTQGHAAGDDVLRAVGDMLRTSVRATDVAARLGGDEFALLLTEVDADAAERVARKLLGSMRREPGSGKKTIAPIRLSIGITMMKSKVGSTAENFLHEADAAMYWSKEQGGDRFSFYAEVAGPQGRKLTDVTA